MVSTRKLSQKCLLFLQEKLAQLIDYQKVYQLIYGVQILPNQVTVFQEKKIKSCRHPWTCKDNSIISRRKGII